MGLNRTITSMVLRLILAFLILFQAQNTFAISKRKKRAFSQAKKAFKASNYSKTISILKKNFNLKSRKTPIGAVQLAGYSFNKLKKYREADVAFTTLIKRKYRRTSARIIRKYKKAGNADNVGNIQSKLSIYYYHKAYAIAQTFLTNYNNLDENSRKSYKKNAIMYANLAIEGEYDEEDPEQILADINNFNNKVEGKKYKYGAFLGINYVTWRDKLTLIDSAGGESTLISNSEGLCLGGGLRKFNAEIEYNINGCVGINNATVGNSTSTNVNYFQKNVPVIGLMVAAGMVWKPKTEGTGLGIHLPVMYRKGDYTNPSDVNPNLDFTLEGASIISIGALVEGKWNFEKWEMSVKFGKFTKLDSSYWSIGMQYGF